MVIEFWNYRAALLEMMTNEQTRMVVVHKWFCLTPDSAQYIHGRNMMITKKPGLTMFGFFGDVFYAGQIASRYAIRG